MHNKNYDNIFIIVVLARSGFSYIHIYMYMYMYVKSLLNTVDRHCYNARSLEFYCTIAYNNLTVKMTCGMNRMIQFIKKLTIESLELFWFECFRYLTTLYPSKLKWDGQQHWA